MRSTISPVRRPPATTSSNPIKTMKTSVMGAINVLGMAKRCRAKVLQASTSEVYGDPEVHPQPESYRGAVNPIGPRACYDEGKRAAETLFMDYHRMNKVQRADRADFQHLWASHAPVRRTGDLELHPPGPGRRGFFSTIFGDGSQTRSFCYATSWSKAMLRMMGAPDDFIGPVNIGNPNEFTIRELAQLVLELTAPPRSWFPIRCRPTIRSSEDRILR